MRSRSCEKVVIGEINESPSPYELRDKSMPLVKKDVVVKVSHTELRTFSRWVAVSAKISEIASYYIDHDVIVLRASSLGTNGTQDQFDIDINTYDHTMVSKRRRYILASIFPVTHHINVQTVCLEPMWQASNPSS